MTIFSGILVHDQWRTDRVCGASHLENPDCVLRVWVWKHQSISTIFLGLSRTLSLCLSIPSVSQGITQAFTKFHDDNPSVCFVFSVSLSRSPISFYILLCMHVSTYLFLPSLLKSCHPRSVFKQPPRRPVLLARISSLPWPGFSFYFLLPILPSLEVAILAPKFDNGYFIMNYIMFFCQQPVRFENGLLKPKSPKTQMRFLQRLVGNHNSDHSLFLTKTCRRPTEKQKTTKTKQKKNTKITRTLLKTSNSKKNTKKHDKKNTSKQNWTTKTTITKTTTKEQGKLNNMVSKRRGNSKTASAIGQKHKKKKQTNKQQGQQKQQQ